MTNMQITPITLEHEEPIQDRAEPKAEGIETKVHYMDDMDYHSMANHFDLDFDTRRDPNIAEKLSFLSDWAKDQIGSENQIEQMITIKKLAQRLGYNMRGPELIKKLYMWTRLDSQRKGIERKMEAII